MSQFMQICVGIFGLLGIVVSVISGIIWRTKRIFHLAPFAYAIVGYLVLRPFDTSHSFNWRVPLGLGAILYAAAWISLLETRKKYRK
jgi:hypothetical protein